MTDSTESDSGPTLMEDIPRIAAWLREWSDKDLAHAPHLVSKSLGYIAARMLEHAREEIADKEKLFEAYQTVCRREEKYRDQLAALQPVVVAARAWCDEYPHGKRSGHPWTAAHAMLWEALRALDKEQGK